MKRSGPLETGKNITYHLPANIYYSVYFNIETAAIIIVIPQDNFSK